MNKYPLIIILFLTAVLLTGCVSNTTEVKDCGTDKLCFALSAKTCSLAKVKLNDFGVDTYMEVLGGSADACKISVRLGEVADSDFSNALNGKSMTCTIPTSEMTLDATMTSTNLLSKCTGDLADFLNGISNPIGIPVTTPIGIINNETTVCIEGQAQECKVGDCIGKQVCYKGAWTNCVTDPYCVQDSQPEQPIMINETAITPTYELYDQCGNGIGWSYPTFDSHCKTADCCGWYVTTHAHDLGKIALKGTLSISYRPGYIDGCTSPVYVYTSKDNSNWVKLYAGEATSVDTDSSVGQSWKTYYQKFESVGGFRYVKIEIPKCYNDYSDAKFVGEIGEGQQCSPGSVEKCTTTQNCAGKKYCKDGFWSDCLDYSDDGCPYGNECKPGEARYCTTSDGCSGKQYCADTGVWKEGCNDIPYDGCPSTICKEGETKPMYYTCPDGTVIQYTYCKCYNGQWTCPTIAPSPSMCPSQEQCAVGTVGDPVYYYCSDGTKVIYGYCTCMYDTSGTSNQKTIWACPAIPVGYVPQECSASNETFESGLTIPLEPITVNSATCAPSTDSAVKMIFFHSPTCPYCTSQVPVIEQLKQKYGAKLEVEYACKPIHSGDDAICLANADSLYTISYNASLLLQSQMSIQVTGTPTAVINCDYMRVGSLALSDENYGTSKELDELSKIVEGLT